MIAATASMMPRSRIAMRKMAVSRGMSLLAARCLISPDSRAPLSRALTPPAKSVRVAARAAASSAASVVRPIHPELEPGDDPGVVSDGEIRIRIPRGHPGVIVLRVGDHVREAAATQGEERRRLVVRIAEGVHAGPAFRTGHEVAGSELLLSFHVPPDGAAAEDEEHLLCAVVHVHTHARGARPQLPQGGSH